MQCSTKHKQKHKKLQEERTCLFLLCLCLCRRSVFSLLSLLNLRLLLCLCLCVYPSENQPLVDKVSQFTSEYTHTETAKEIMSRLQCWFTNTAMANVCKLRISLTALEYRVVLTVNRSSLAKALTPQRDYVSWGICTEAYVQDFCFSAIAKALKIYRNKQLLQLLKNVCK